MGICYSCLGLRRRDSHDVSNRISTNTGVSYSPVHSARPVTLRGCFSQNSCLPVYLYANLRNNKAESARLLDDDLYQSGYGYGALNQARQNQPDPEDLKREREALEAICQRTSE